MGATTYRLMYGFAIESASESDEPSDEDAATAELINSNLHDPPSWANTRLVSGDAVEAVAAMKRDGTNSMRTHHR